MKRILTTCLLGIGSLLLTTTAPCKANASTHFSTTHALRRIVSVSVQGYDLLITSSGGSGAISTVTVFTTGYTKLIEQGCSGYECVVNIADLKHGTYIARVTTTSGTTEHTFYVN